jgi:hypothetical protein
MLGDAARVRLGPLLYTALLTLLVAAFAAQPAAAQTTGPTAVAVADVTAGPAPLTVHFDGSQSVDPLGGGLTYAWDLNDDGRDDSTLVNPTFTYQVRGLANVRLTVRDASGRTDSTLVAIRIAGPPTAGISAPDPATTWAVGDTIEFAGGARDSFGFPLGPNALSWRVTLEHCDRAGSKCHTHVLQTLTGDHGSVVAPDHGYPSHLDIQLTATDDFGLTTTVTRRLEPKTVPITLRSQPAGIKLTLGADTGKAPFTVDVIQGSHLTLRAPVLTTRCGWPYVFGGWSDRGAIVHDIVAGSAPATYTAKYFTVGRPRPCRR